MIAPAANSHARVGSQKKASSAWCLVAAQLRAEGDGAHTRQGCREYPKDGQAEPACEKPQEENRDGEEQVKLLLDAE
jgi:hypothetical protein